MSDDAGAGTAGSEALFAAAASYAGQAAAAVAAAADVEGLPVSRGISGVVVVAEGDASIAGDVLARCFAARHRVPVLECEHAVLPGWVGPDALVVAVSHDGEDLETVAAVREALHRGSRVVAVCRGGVLAEAAGARGVPVVAVPEAERARDVFPALALPVVVLAARLGIVAGVDADLDEAVAVLDAATVRYAPRASEETNMAARLARKLRGRVPVVHGATAPTVVAARRFKSQLNENAGAPAFWGAHPAAGHDEVCAWTGGGEPRRDLFVVVQLRDRTEDWRAARRYASFREIVEGSVADVVDVQSTASTPLGVCFEHVAAADWTSLHLAALTGTDPAAVDAAARVSERLREP